MGRSRLDGARWARIARRGGVDPSVAGEDAQYLTVDPTSGALVVTGAGAAPSATALRIANGGPGEAKVGTDGAVLVRDVTGAEAMVDTANFPTAPLAAGATFTGEFVDVLPYAAITVVVFTDAPSAAGGAVVDFSADGVTVVRSVSASIPAGVGSYFSLAPEARFYRLRYTNGSTDQTVLRGQVLLRYQPPALVEQPLGSQITDVNLAQIVRSAVSGRLPDGRYLPVAITADQRLMVDVEHEQPLTDAQLRATAIPVTFPPDEAGLTNAELRATPVQVATPAGLATDAALVPLLDGVEALLTTLRDTVYRRTDPLPAGTASIGHVTLDLEAETLLLLPSAARTTSGQSAAFDTSRKSRIAVDVSITAVSGTLSPALRVFVDRLGADGLWYAIYTSPSMTSPGTISTTVGQGMTVGQSLAASCRLRWEITGTGPSVTFAASVVGK